MVHSDFDLNYQNNNIESKIVAGLERISHSFRILLWEASKENKLTPLQIQVMLFLNYHDSKYCNVSYLSKEFNVTKATISETIRILEEKNLIKKSKSDDDSRSYSISLTDKGKELADKHALFTNQIHQCIQSLSKYEKEIFLNIILNIIHQLVKSGVINVQRMCFTCKYYQYKENQHFCLLLNRALETRSIRVDCPEHEML